MIQESKYIFGIVTENFFGVVTIEVYRECRSFIKGDKVPIVGRHKYPVGSTVGLLVNNGRVVRTLALLPVDKWI